MTRSLILITSLLLTIQTLFSQEEETEYFPFQFSFVYPIGTSGSNSPQMAYSLSINVLTGITGSVDGFELAGLVNVNKKNLSGFQMAGIGNHTFGNVEGLQLGGIFNIAHHEATGFQGGGIFNLVGGKSEGVQIAGITNLTGENAELQLAGIINVADNIDGIQVAGINNIADTVTGIQIAGLVNICDSIDGIPIAPFSYVKKNGYRRFEISTSEVFYFNIAYKMGVKRFYTIFQYGFNTDYSPFYSGFGVGAGTNYTLKNKLSIDLEALSIYIQDNWKWDENNSLTVLRGHLAYNFSERIAVFGGPSISLLVSEDHNDLENIPPQWFAEIDTPYNSDFHGIWIGFNAGLRF